MDTVSDNYVSAKVASLHPSQLHVSKTSNMTYDRPLSKELVNTFTAIVHASHLSEETSTFKE